MFESEYASCDFFADVAVSCLILFCVCLSFIFYFDLFLILLFVTLCLRGYSAASAAELGFVSVSLLWSVYIVVGEECVSAMEFFAAAVSFDG
jgi:hypothetical protein